MFTDAVFSCPGETVNSALAKSVPVYAFEFNDPNAVTKMKAPGDLPSLGSFHSSSLVYAFQSPIAGLAEPSMFDPAQARMSDAFSLAWATFARTGNPNWRAFDPSLKNVQVFTPEGARQSTEFSTEHKCAFWSGLGLN